MYRFSMGNTHGSTVHPEKVTAVLLTIKFILLMLAVGTRTVQVENLVS